MGRARRQRRMTKTGGEEVSIMGDYFFPEPSLSQMLADPLTQVLMQSDGVKVGDLQALISEARLRIAGAGDETGERPD